MANILVAATPSPGHVNPMLSVARHLSSLGHSQNTVESCSAVAVFTNSAASVSAPPPSHIQSAAEASGTAGFSNMPLLFSGVDSPREINCILTSFCAFYCAEDVQSCMSGYINMWHSSAQHFG
jgi:hypothetical protein